MKRAAAIVGPTPSFVRWSIGYQCPYRQVQEDHLPDPTFRQLRNLRELSIGFLEGRVLGDFCLHPEFNQSSDTSRGFPVEEVLPFFGGIEQIKSNCENCPANVAIHKSLLVSNQKSSNKNVWAGCFGWMRSKNDAFDLITEFQSVAGDNVQLCDLNDPSMPIMPTDPRARIWFQIWQCERWVGEPLSWLNDFVSSFSADIMTLAPELFEFRQAVSACFQNELPLMTELIPAGDSDGIVWRIEPHCSICRCEMDAHARQCTECGNRGHAIPQRKRKVLGLRPYMLLKDLIGLDQTEALLSRYRDRKKMHE